MAQEGCPTEKKVGIDYTWRLWKQVLVGNRGLQGSYTVRVGRLDSYLKYTLIKVNLKRREWWRIQIQRMATL